MAGTVTAAYLEGIKGERELLRDMVKRGDYVAAIDAPAILANVIATMRQGWSGDMLESMRGARDFWRNQVAKLEREGGGTMSADSNLLRVKRAVAMRRAFAKESGEQFDAVQIRDMIADLMHLADALWINFDHELSMATDFYGDETATKAA